MAGIVAQAVEHQADVQLGEMVVSDLGRIGWVSGELSLETELDPGGRAGIFLEAEVLLKDPDEVGGKATLGQQCFPSHESIFEGWALVAESVFHCVD